MENRTALVEEVIAGRREYITDGYPMSIGEIVSNYKEGEIIINPDFQRNFRWNHTLRSRLIESILIGVPIPSIFVYQTELGKWEVVDGVQRLSTIFEFMGVLKDRDGNLIEPSEMTKTKLLPSLEGMTWDKLPKEPLQIDFRRTKLEFKIIKNTSHRDAKFEVFQRLNYSSPLSGQEFRNAVLIMIDLDRYLWIKDLSEYPSFQECIDLTERWKDEKYDFELVLRLFLFRDFADKPIYKVDDFINEYLLYDDENSLLKRIESGLFNPSLESEKFKKVFRILHKAKGTDTFKKSGRGTQFLESYFEAIAIGVLANSDSFDEFNQDDIEFISKKIQEIDGHIPKAPNTSGRIPLTVGFGKKYFSK